MAHQTYTYKCKKCGDVFEVISMKRGKRLFCDYCGHKNHMAFDREKARIRRSLA